MLGHLPRQSAFVRSIARERAWWGEQEYLLAVIADALHVANWQRQGDKRKPRPKTLPRPGSSATTTERRTSLTPRQVHARLLDLKRRANARKR